MIKERKILSVPGSRSLTAQQARSAAARIKTSQPEVGSSASTEAARRRYLGHFGASDRQVGGGASGRHSRAR
jgi:hypothetical protein